MAVKRKQYAMELEKALKKAKTLNEAHSLAGKKASVKKEDKYHKPSLTDRAILSVLKVLRRTPKEKGADKVQKQGKEKYGTDLKSELAKLRRKGKGKSPSKLKRSK